MENNTQPEAIASFIALCEFETLNIDGVNIHHNLSKWQMSLKPGHVNGGQLYCDITVPYADMNLSVSNIAKDNDFFGYSTARLSLISNPDQSGLMSYLTSRSVSVAIEIGHATETSKDIYILFDTPYFYPHNVYTLSNKDYLYKKIERSQRFIKDFIAGYDGIFQAHPQLMMINSTVEATDYYELNIILKNYMTLTYIDTDVDAVSGQESINFHLLIKKELKSNHDIGVIAKFRQQTLRIPRRPRRNCVELPPEPVFRFYGSIS
jgi:hypothetical protein